MRIYGNRCKFGDFFFFLLSHAFLFHFQSCVSRFPPPPPPPLLPCSLEQTCMRIFYCILELSAYLFFSFFFFFLRSRVSKLMKRICNPEKALDEVIEPSRLSSKKKASIKAAVGKWTFDAHALSEDELLYAACVMIEHALQMPELMEWRISSRTYLSMQWPSSEALSFGALCWGIGLCNVC